MKVVDLMNYLATFPGETEMKDVPVTVEMEKEEEEEESKKDATGL